MTKRWSSTRSQDGTKREASKSARRIAKLETLAEQPLDDNAPEDAEEFETWLNATGKR